MNYVCIGAGISSLMFSYRLLENLKKNGKDGKIIILEKGKKIELRKCPILEKKTDRCLKCRQCAIVSGEAGAGSFNDGKYIMPDRVSYKSYGGWLGQYMDFETMDGYIRAVDKALMGFAKEPYPLYEPSNDFPAECLKYDMYALSANIRHFGSDGNYQVMSDLIAYLKSKGVEIITDTDIEQIDTQKKQIKANTGVFNYDKLFIGAGRTGMAWFEDFCKTHGIEMVNNRVDIGVRVEIPDSVCKNIIHTIYEPKILVRTKPYGDIVRTFCWNNNRAKVCVENNSGILSVNGFANSIDGEDTGNSNFALLSSINFSTPFKYPTQYAQYVAAMSNMISNNSVLVQRFGDLKLGRRTNDHRLSQSTTVPSLKTAVAGDISLALPKRILDNICSALEQLNNVFPGIANYDTLLYSPEIKMYSAKPVFLNEKFEILDDVFCFGDCSSVTRSLSQAGAMGVYVADCVEA